MQKYFWIFFLTILFLLNSNWAGAQIVPVGSIVWDDYLRDKHLQMGKDKGSSLLIRPLSGDSANILPDSTPYYSKKKYKRNFAITLLPLRLNQQYNNHHPYGWNDGAVIPANNYQALASTGIYLEAGPLSLQLQPEVVIASNKNFPGFAPSFPDSIWSAWYVHKNRVDVPERFGSKAYVKLFPGQSSLRLNSKQISLGISTENLWWGPGIRNALLMSNNAPGFPHLTFNSRKPLRTFAGSFEWQVVAGLLSSSGFIPADTSRTYQGVRLYIPKQDEERYFNGMAVVWEPKWTPGLYLGFARAFYQYRSDVQRSLDGYVPVIGATFKNNGQEETETVAGRDQLLSLFFRWVLPLSRTEVYAEYGRNDRALNTRDLLQEPEHARAYIVGARKFAKNNKGKDILLFFEMTQLQMPPTYLVRDAGSWYTHGMVRHGYTHKGQVIGAGIGPGGSNSQSLGVSWYANKAWGKSTLMIERVVRDNDFFYDAFAADRDFTRHWVDFSLNFRRVWQYRQLLFGVNSAFIRSYNYQWRLKHTPEGKKDVHNVNLNFSLAYRWSN